MSTDHYATIRVDKGLHRRLKILSAKEGITLSQVIKSLLKDRATLERQKKIKAALTKGE